MNRSDHENGDASEDWTEDYSGEGADDDALHSAQPGPEPSLSLVVSDDEAGLRFDRLIAQRCPDVSRSRIQKWIADGFAHLDGKPCKTSQTVHPGQRADIRPPADLPVNDWQSEPAILKSIEIVHEDDQVMVINKPCGLVVHPAAGHAAGTLINGLLAHCADLNKVARCGIVHRLDRDTTGLMVVAKTPAAQFSLVNQLQKRSVSREYLALAWGAVSKQTVHTLMGRDARDRQRMAVLPQMRADPLANQRDHDNGPQSTAGRGKEAITHIEPMSSGELFGLEVTLVRCRLETGRTHQIRVHLEHIGHPIVGDKTYTRRSPHASKLGDGYAELKQGLPGQALHALGLRFIHPVSGLALEFKAKPPSGFMSLLKLAGIRTRGRF